MDTVVKDHVEVQMDTVVEDHVEDHVEIQMDTVVEDQIRQHVTHRALAEMVSSAWSAVTLS